MLKGFPPLLREAIHSLAPVLRGERGGEGFVLANANLLSIATCPSPLPSPQSTGERD